MSILANKYHLDLFFFQGIDGKNIKTKDSFVCCQYKPRQTDYLSNDFKHLLIENNYHLINTSLTQGEVGLYITLVLLLNNLVKTKTPWAIICEDDVTFHHQIKEHIHQIMIDLPKLSNEGVELIYLNDRTIGSNDTNKGILNRYFPVEKGFGFDGFLISEVGANKLLQILNPLYYGIDVQTLTHVESFRKYSSYKFIEHNLVKPTLTIKGFKFHQNLIINNYEKSVIHDCPFHIQTSERLNLKP